MKKAQFTATLRLEFEGHPLQERFLEEMQAHMEDMEEEGGDFNPQKIEERMGIPHQIKRQFIAIVDPWRNAFFVAEALMVGFALLIVHTVFYTSILDFFSEGGANWKVFILFPILFLFTFQMLFIRFSEIKGLTNLREWLWMVIVTVPGIVAFLASLLLGPLSVSLRPIQLILLILSYLFLNAILIAVARWIAKSRPRVNFVARLPLWLYYSAILIVVGRTWLTYASLEWLANHRLLTFIFSPLFLFDQLFDVAWKNIDSGPFLAIYLPMAIIGFVLIYAVIFSFRVKRWNTDRGLVLLYFGSLLFVNPQAFIQPPEFSSPSIHVSSRIEKEQLSVFYPYFKYSGLNKGWNFVSNLELKPESNTLFHYQVEPYDEGFLLKNNLDQNFYLNPSHFSDDLEPPDYKNLLKKITPSRQVIFSNNTLSNFEWASSDYELKDLAQSEDGKWLLLVISHKFIDSDEVFLLENSTASE